MRHKGALPRLPLKASFSISRAAAAEIRVLTTTTTKTTKPLSPPPSPHRHGAWPYFSGIIGDARKDHSEIEHTPIAERARNTGDTTKISSRGDSREAQITSPAERRESGSRCYGVESNEAGDESAAAARDGWPDSVDAAEMAEHVRRLHHQECRPGVAD